MKIPFRPRPGQPIFTEPVVTDPIEAHIAVGSLAGIAPSGIHTHVLLVVTDTEGLSITGTACPEQALAIITAAASTLALRALAAHVNGEHS